MIPIAPTNIFFVLICNDVVAENGEGLNRADVESSFGAIAAEAESPAVPALEETGPANFEKWWEVFQVCRQKGKKNTRGAAAADHALEEEGDGSPDGSSS